MRLQQIVDRSKSIIIDEKKYVIPRSIREKLFYRDCSIKFNESRAFRDYCEAPGINSVLRSSKLYQKSLRPLPIYAAALAFKRSVDSSRFDRQLRKGTPKIYDKNSIGRARAVCHREKAVYLNREKTAEQNYIQQLKKSYE